MNVVNYLREFFFSFLLFVLSFSCLYASDEPKIGILVMAHGGDTEWNAAVEKAVEPIKSLCPTTIAFGMADRDSLQNGVYELEEQGVNRIAVIRLFVSTDSFRHQTEYFLGVRSDPPKQFIYHHHDKKDSKNEEHNSLPIQKDSLLILNKEGLADSPLIGEIIVKRILKQSKTPEKESVLILAHGTEDNSENALWIAKMQRILKDQTLLRLFESIQIATLREDWPDQRLKAEKQIRAFVKEKIKSGNRVIVVPFRVFGFGPYRDVLKNLKYEADGLGLLPHPNVTKWIKTQAIDCFSRAHWKNPFSED